MISWSLYKNSSSRSSKTSFEQHLIYRYCIRMQLDTGDARLLLPTTHFHFESINSLNTVKCWGQCIPNINDLYILGMSKYRVDRILPAYRSRNDTALLCATRLIIDKQRATQEFEQSAPTSCLNVRVVSAVAIMERTTGRCRYASWRTISPQRQVCSRRGRLGQWLARHNHCATVDAVINRSTRR